MIICFVLQQRKKTIVGIEKLRANKYLNAIKRTTPLSFITSKEIDPKTMPPVPKDPNSWEEYFLQICSTRLSLVLAKEKEQFDADLAEPCERLRPKMIDQFKRLRIILRNPGVPPRERPYPFTATTRYFRATVSEMIGENLH